MTDVRGHPTHSALAFPTTPCALAVSGIYVLAACADGLHAYDRATSAWVQSLPYPGGARTAPGQQLSSAQNASGSCVLIAGYRKVCVKTAIAKSLPDFVARLHSMPVWCIQPDMRSCTGHPTGFLLLRQQQRGYIKPRIDL